MFDLSAVLEFYLSAFAAVVGLWVVVWCVRRLFFPKAVESPESELRAAAARYGMPTVLVVDDSVVARTKLTKLFKSVGLGVISAENGQAALDVLESRAGDVNVIVTDLDMPVMDGFTLIGEVKRGLNTASIPMIAISGSTELRAKISECGGLYGIFAKPWSDRDLIERVQTLIKVSR